MSKELWFAEMEARLSELEDEGVPFETAYEQASNEAAGRVTDRVADMADFERKRRRDEAR